jgi:LysR family glycine cleavage system transcriptional activator
MRRTIPATHALLCFEASARLESFTRAAQELSLTQSAISRQITALEELIGTPLFRRTRHGVALTQAGSRYAKLVTLRLRALEQDTLDVMSTQGKGGSLQLASVPTFAARWLIPRLTDFAKQHPDITVHIDTRTRPFMFADTLFDAALYSGTAEQVAQWAGTRAQMLLPEEVVPVCCPALLQQHGQGNESLSPAAIASLPLLQQSTRPECWQAWFAACGVDAPMALAGPRYELFSMTAAAAIQGLGVGLIPRLLIEEELAQGHLVVAHAKALPEARHYWAVQPESAAPNTALDSFLTWMHKQAGGD